MFHVSQFGSVSERNTMSDEKWEPWVDYPDIWPTKSKFFTYLRGSLRQAVWNKSPIKITFKNGACSKPPEGYTGKAKSGAYCALSGVWEGKSKLEIDHKSGNVPINDEDEILNFIKHLIPPPNSLQCVTKDAHKVKSYSERTGKSFEEANAEKQAILLCKEKADIEWLEARGVTPEKSSPKRRKQIVECLLNDS